MTFSLLLLLSIHPPMLPSIFCFTALPKTSNTVLNRSISRQCCSANLIGYIPVFHHEI